MDLKEAIKTLSREIEVYRSHSLFEEAKGKCRKLAKLIQQNDRIKNRQDVVFDVACQRGNLISVIIPGRDRVLVENFKTGLRIDDVQFYSPAVVFHSPCLVSAVNQILTGPQKGGHALVMQVLYE
jgi:hypothetical protein